MFVPVLKHFKTLPVLLCEWTSDQNYSKIHSFKMDPFQKVAYFRDKYILVYNLFNVKEGVFKA